MSGSSASSLDLNQYKRIVVLTGAGVSVASGLRPYRGPGGLWEEHDSSAVATAESFAADPMAVWNFFGPLRSGVAEAKPNAAHESLAEIERQISGSLTIITQNVDGLHQRAGSKNVVEIHGNILRTRCNNDKCELESFADESVPTTLPSCRLCGNPLRPDIVLFKEPMPVHPEWLTKRALNECDLFLAIGTSGTVSPASNFVRSAEYAGARTILVNLQPMDPPNPAFQQQILGRAEEILPSLLGL